MTMISRFVSKPAALGLMLALSAVAGLAQDGRAPLAVSAVEPIPSLTRAMAATGKAGSLARVVEAYDSQLIDRLNAGRKFQIVATIDDFDDQTESMEFTNLNRVGFKRTIRLSTTAKIYDSTTGNLMESANVRLTRKDDRMNQEGLQRDAEETDVLLLEITRDAAEQIATRIADLVFPVRVLIKRDQQITINRGDGAGVEVGQVFNVFAEGETLVDPDTGEILGREEVLVGKARVVSVQPKFSTAELLEDLGIDRGAVLRPAPTH